MNNYLILVLGIILFKYALNFIVDNLNLKSADPHLPEEFKGYYDKEKYEKSQFGKTSYM